MFTLVLLSFFVAVVLALTAYLQCKARWWCGLLAAFGLFAVGWVIASNIPVDDLRRQLPPLAYFGLAAWIAAPVILVGSGLALLLRRGRFGDRVPVIVFFGGWVTTFVLFVTIASL